MSIPQPNLARRRRVTAIILAVLILGGLALRLYLVNDRNWTGVGHGFKFEGDEQGYHDFAWDLFQGHFFRWPFRVPVYPLFIAAVYWAAGPMPQAVLVAQALLGAGTVWLTYRLGRMVTGRTASLIAAALVAFNYEMAYQATRLYTEVLYTALLLAMLIAFYRALRRPTFGRFGVSGVWLGVLNLCRPTGALLPIAMAFTLPWRWAFSRRVVLIAVFGLAMLIPIAPWTLHNWRQHNAFMPFAVSTAVLWQGSPEFYHRIESGKTLLDVWQTDLNPKVNGGHSPHTIEGDKWFNQRAKESIKAEPGVWITYCVKKAVYFWYGNPATDWPYAYYEYYTRERHRGILSARALTSVGLLSLLLICRSRRVRRFGPMLMVCLYFTAIHAVTYPETRYSYPLYPILALITGTAVMIGRQKIRA